MPRLPVVATSRLARLALPLALAIATATVVGAGSAAAATDINLGDTQPVTNSGGVFSEGAYSVNGHLYLKSMQVGFRDGTGGEGSQYDLEYNLGRQCSRVATTLGLADNSASDAQFKLEVLKDGVSVAAPTMKLGSSQNVTFDATNVLRVTFRVTLVKRGASGYSYPTIATPVGTCLGVPARTSFSVPTVQITAGQTAHLTGLLTDIGGDPVGQGNVNLYYLNGNGYSRAESPTTVSDATGHYSFDVAPTVTTTYQTGYVDTAGERQYGGGTVLVTVSPRLFFTTVRPVGRLASRVDGKLLPANSGQVVTLRKGTATGAVLARATTDNNGHWHARLRFRAKGAYRIVATTPVTSTNAAAAVQRTVTVTR